MRESIYRRLPSPYASLPRAEYDAAMALYRESLRSSERYSGSGDLVRYFGQNFFHDSMLSHVRFGFESQSFSFRAASLFVEDAKHRGLRPYPEFDVRFEQVVSFEWHGGRRTQRIFIGCEIDGRDDLIATAEERYGSRFHSLAIDAYGQSLEFVFGSVRVTPRDPQRWDGILKDPALNVLGLFE